MGISVSVYDDDTTLPELYAKASIDWGDGYGTVLLGEGTASVGSPLVVSASKVLPAGLHVIKVSATNRRSTTPDAALKVIFVHITEDKVKPQDPIIVGPIIPRDEGFPSSSQWMLDAGKDDTVLASNVKALLITSPGDRVMTPEYGVNLRQFIFSMDIKLAESMAKAEISRAISQWENRALVRKVTLARSGSTECEIIVELESKLSRQNFTVSSKLTA